MPTQKPRLAADDDIIDLTDLGDAGGSGSDDEPVDMSFENELDDLFGDVDSAPAKAAAPATDDASDDDVLDLTGLGLDEPTAASDADDADDDALDLAGFALGDDAATADADDDVLDLAGLDLDAPSATAGGDDDALDLAGLDLNDEAAPATAGADDDALDLAGMDFGDDALSADAGEADSDALDLGGLDFDAGEPAPATAGADDDALDLGDLDFGDAGLPASDAADDALGLGDDALTADEADGDALDLGGLGPDAELDAELDALEDANPDDAGTGLDFGDLDDDKFSEPAAAADDALDMADLDLDGLLDGGGTAKTPPPLLAVDDDAITDDLLDTLPEAPAPGGAPAGPDLGLDFDDDALPDLGEAPAEADAGLTDAALAAGAVAAGAVAAAAVAMAAGKDRAAPKEDAINLAALDELIDTAKGSHAEAAPEGQNALAAISALSDRLAALEAASASLAGKFDALPPPADEEFLASALAIRLEETLAARLDPLLAAQGPSPDLEGFKKDLLAEIEARKPDRGALLAELGQELPPAGDLVHKADMAEAMDSLRAAIARLEALSQARQTQFADFSDALETRIAEMRREMPAPEDFVSPQSFSGALEGLRETLRLDFSQTLESRLQEVVEAARQAAREEVAALGQSLGARLDALEGDRLDPGAVTSRLDALEAGRFDPDALTSRLDSLEAHIAPQALAERVRDALAPDFAGKAALEDVAQTAAAAEKIANDALAGLEAKPGAETLDAAVGALRDEMASATEAAAHTAEEAISSLGDALAARLQTLETRHIDPESLAERVRNALLKQLPDAQALQETAETAIRAENAANDALARLDGKVGGEELDAAVSPLRDELTRTADAASQMAREEVQALGDALAGRLDTLESKTIDPESLAQRIRSAVLSELPDADSLQQTSETAVRAENTANDALARLGSKLNVEALEAALKALRDEIIKEIERIVPGAAAAIIRQEINALAKELL